MDGIHSCEYGIYGLLAVSYNSSFGKSIDRIHTTQFVERCRFVLKSNILFTDRNASTSVCTPHGAAHFAITFHHFLLTLHLWTIWTCAGDKSLLHCSCFDVVVLGHCTAIPCIWVANYCLFCRRMLCTDRTGRGMKYLL